MRLINLVLIILFLNNFNLGQIISSRLPDSEQYKKDNKVSIVYDVNKNLTTVYSEFLLIYKNSGSLLNLGELIANSYSFTHIGQKMDFSPTVFELKLTSQGNYNWKFTKDESRHLVLIVDKESFDLGQLKQLSSRQFNDGNAIRKRFEEILAIDISLDNFSKMVNGKKVILKLGKNYKMEINKLQLKTLQDFLLLAKNS